MRTLIFLAFLVALVPAQPAVAEGRIVRVTLYRGQALVTREVPLPARAGMVEVVVPDMPAGVIPDSLYAEAGEGVEVRAVRFRTRAVGEEPREEVRALDTQIETVRRELAAIESAKRLLGRRLQYLEKLENFVVPTSHGDLSRGVLDAEALERIVSFGFEQGKAANEELLRIEGETRDLQARLSVLERERAQLHASSTKTLREAVLFIEKRAPAAAVASLSYTVGNCGWAPAYNIRARESGAGVQVEYNAVIQQMTGEDWTAVALTLSTATPAMSAAGPGLAPFAVTLRPGVSGPEDPAAHSRAAVAETYQNLAKKQQEAQERLRDAVLFTENVKSAWDVNLAAIDYQTFELVTGKDVLAAVRTGAALERGPSISYGIAGAVSLASRSDQQMVRIALANLEGTVAHVATPVLTPHVYREAAVTNTSGQAFLGGPVNVYLDNRFVGRAEFPSVAEGESFVIGLGADPRLRARRELVDKSEKTRGGNRILDLSVRIQIENFHDRPVAIRILDRLPHTDREEALRVTLGTLSDPLSADAAYLATDRPLGILRWDIEAPAAASGSGARAVSYGYSLEFDRSLSLVSPAGPQQERFREEFERLMRARNP